jgi:proteic killer suppression protein
MANLRRQAYRSGGVALRAVIRSFARDETRALFEGHRIRGLPEDIQERAALKLFVIDAADELEDLRSPPGNRLERLVGDRAGQHSIRINDRWRICFTWRDGDAYHVEIVDYHR